MIYGNTFSGLSAGEHSWSIVDLDGCTATGISHVDSQSSIIKIFIIILLLLCLIFKIVVTGNASVIAHEKCFGAGEGQILIVATGGAGPYTYSVCSFIVIITVKKVVDI